MRLMNGETAIVKGLTKKELKKKAKKLDTSASNPLADVLDGIELTREWTTAQWFSRIGLVNYTKVFEEQGYDSVGFILDAEEQELEELLARDPLPRNRHPNTSYRLRACGPVLRLRCYSSTTVKSSFTLTRERRIFCAV